MNTQAQTLTAVVVLGVLDAVIPFFPVLALVLVYVVVAKPPWFAALVRDLYR